MEAEPAPTHALDQTAHWANVDERIGAFHARSARYPLIRKARRLRSDLRTVVTHTAQTRAAEPSSQHEMAPRLTIVMTSAGQRSSSGQPFLEVACDTILNGTSESQKHIAEIIVVIGPEFSGCQDIFDHERIRAVFDDEPFNFSRRSNIGAALAQSEFIMFANDDVEVRDDNWVHGVLTALHGRGRCVVGANLAYPDDTIQHGGIFFVDTLPDHIFANRSLNDPLVNSAVSTTRELSAVTGAVLCTSAATFGLVGGFTQRLPLAYNDVDFCLKVRGEGGTVVVPPGIPFYHHESQSREPTVSDAEIATLHQRWLHELSAEKFVDPSISLPIGRTGQ